MNKKKRFNKKMYFGIVLIALSTVSFFIEENTLILYFCKFTTKSTLSIHKSIYATPKGWYVFEHDKNNKHINYVTDTFNKSEDILSVPLNIHYKKEYVDSVKQKLFLTPLQNKKLNYASKNVNNYQIDYLTMKIENTELSYMNALVPKLNILFSVRTPLSESELAEVYVFIENFIKSKQ